jgi:2,4-didehydro-3-deoxy-L-rhamnonate hydrolase
MSWLPPRAWFRLAGPSPHQPGPLGMLVAEEWHDLSPLLGSAAFDSEARLQDGTLSAAGLTELASQLGRSTRLAQRPRFGLPVARPGKILCLGKNYHAHAAEFGSEAPKQPMFFNKLPECLLPALGSVALPADVGRVDHEAELCLVIGRSGKDLSLEDAPGIVYGATLIDDVTARDMQGCDRKLGHPWVRAKSFDSFGPVGPWVVPYEDLFADGVVPPNGTPELEIECYVDGERKQSSNTRLMVHDVAHMIAHLSRHTTLRPGDLIATGTPEGVSPLHAGSEVEVRCQSIGSLCHQVH